MENFWKLLIPVILASLAGVAAMILKLRKEHILSQVNGFVQKVEARVQGSGMGPMKKQLVIAQLNAAGIKVTAWLSKAIDRTVAILNEKNGWLTENGTQQDLFGD